MEKEITVKIKKPVHGRLRIYAAMKDFTLSEAIMDLLNQVPELKKLDR